MKIKSLGHSCFQLDVAGKTLIIDPFISGNELAKSIDVNSLKADYILITHGHMDHMLDAEAISRNNADCLIISNYEIYEWYTKKGIKAHPMNHGGNFNFDFGSLKFVNAIHSSVLPDGTYGGNPGGFVLHAAGKSIYIAGDTALTYDMKLIPMDGTQLDLAILPIGDNFTMGYKDAVLAAKFVECDNVLGCHYDTFAPIVIKDKDAVRSYFEASNINFRLLEIGEVLEL